MNTRDGYKICICCGDERLDRYFYIHRSTLIMSHLSICKECVIQNVKNLDNTSDFNQVLAIMNIPYQQAFVDSAKKKKDGDTQQVQEYFRNLNSLKQNRSSMFKDSDFFDKNAFNKIVEEKINARQEKKRAMNLDYDDMYGKWGIDVEIEEYEKLEKIFARDGGNDAFDETEEAMYITLALNKYLRNKAIEDGDSKRIESFQKLAQNSQKDLNSLKESKSAGEEAFGVFIKKIEDDEPLDENPERWDSKWLKYLHRWVIQQYKLIRGEIRREDIELLDDEDDLRGL